MASKIVTFGLSILMFGIAVLQIFLGYALAGKSGHQKRIYMSEEPTKFWVIVAIPIFIGTISFVVGLVSVFRGRK
ncbi:MAG TPA: hypothetical protein PKY59_17620 [Pyrinomonadaceae bacterium]|nr:hypothetical protein [Pyrinomonadaceae bacterium]